MFEIEVNSFADVLEPGDHVAVNGVLNTVLYLTEINILKPNMMTNYKSKI